jgi:hypothetical protein
MISRNTTQHNESGNFFVTTLLIKVGGERLPRPSRSDSFPTHAYQPINTHQRTQWSHTTAAPEKQAPCLEWRQHTHQLRKINPVDEILLAALTLLDRN